MTERALERRFVALRALRWLPLGVALPVLVLVPLARGVSLGTVGALWTLHALVTLALEVPSGTLADLVGRRQTLLAGGVLMTAALAAYAVARDAVALGAALTALATGRALISGSLEAWFVDALHAAAPGVPVRGALARGTSAEGVAMAAGALVGGALPLMFGGLAREGTDVLIALSPTMLAAAALAAVFVVAVAALVEDHQPRAHPAQSARTVARTAARTIRSTPTIRVVLGIAVAFGVAQAGIELLWQPRVAELLGGAVGDGTLLLGALTAASMLAVSAGALSVLCMTARTAARSAYGAALALAALAVGGLAIAGSVAVFALAYLVFYVALGASDPLHTSLLHNAVEAPVRATMASVDSLAQMAGAAAGNVTLAVVAASAGIPTAWTCCAGVLTLACLLTRALPAPDPSPVGTEAGAARV
jgi:MFS family permease